MVKEEGGRPVPPPPPLPSLRRAGSRSDGRGGGSRSDGDLPFAARPPSDSRPRGSTGESVGAIRASRRRSCGSSPRQGCDWGWDCHPTVRYPFGASLGVQASEVLLETPAEVPGPFPTVTSTGRSAEDLGVPRGSGCTSSTAGEVGLESRMPLEGNGWSRGFTRGRLERRHRNPLHSGHRLQSDSRGGDQVGVFTPTKSAH